MRFFFAVILIFFSFLFSCNRLTSVPTSQSPLPVVKDSCSVNEDNHLVFSILIDGIDVGREVRTISTFNGPLGEERIITSHSVVRRKIGNALIENKFVRNQRTLVSGSLLDCSHVSLDQVNSHTVQIFSDGSTWRRLVESSSSIGKETSDSSETIDVSKVEVFFLDLVDILRKKALKKDSVPDNIVYFDPLLNEPVSLIISSPMAGSVIFDGQEIDGIWCEAKRADSKTTSLRAFFDYKGSLWEEDYPDIHESRRRLPGPLSLSMDSSELWIGLRSEAYIPDPNSATRARFSLKSTYERLNSLNLISIPYNQKVSRPSKTELILDVKAGSSDGVDPPTEADLGSSRYVQPDSPKIIDALRYLKSAGKRGHLSLERRYNATSVISRVSLIRNPNAFWSDPEKVAGLIMHYVSALLPNKSFTSSMIDSVSSLAGGLGDCTEHAVLFASLMRVARIPTRLVSGMVLNPGGFWGVHMWNSYWNGEKWLAIDVSTMSYRPGALYVSLGRGAANFDDIRDHLADFIGNIFSGISFDLIDASNNGETLFLVHPNSFDQNSKETCLFNAVVFSERGDHKGAIKIIEDNFPAEGRPLSIKLMLIELLVLDGRQNEALVLIRSLREETSDYKNIGLLDKLELNCLITMGETKGAEQLFFRIDNYLKNKGKDQERILLKAEFLFGLGNLSQAVSLLDEAMDKWPQSTALLIAFADYVSSSPSIGDSSLLKKALDSAKLAVETTMGADPKALTALARSYLCLNEPLEALWTIEHALILVPSDRHLLDLRKQAMSSNCVYK